MRVLIVDDDSISLELLRDTLSDAGHEVHSACDGAAALSLLSQVECDVVVSDWEMPKLDGIGLCDPIRSSATAGYIYVILLTSHNSTTEKIKGLSAGADDF